MNNPTLNLTWNDFDKAVQELSQQVLRDGKPEVIVGIPRGGLPLAVAISHQLDVPLFIPVYGHSYAMISDKNILIVDDISDTGQEMKQQLLHADQFGCKNVRTLVLIEREGTIQPTTYKWKWIDKNQGWVIFPWERKSEVGVQKNINKRDINKNE